MMQIDFSNFRIILASQSPRRAFLLRALGLDITVRTPPEDEHFPPHFSGQDIALYLCREKAKPFEHTLKEKELLITADTVVWINNAVLNKPSGYHDAFRMLKTLQGNTHEVFTGICLTAKYLTKTFSVASKVHFRKLDDGEIHRYIKEFNPFDKAGAYGAQECLPLNYNPCSKDEIEFLKNIGKENLIRQTISSAGKCVIIDHIEGSYFNVMGLPIKELWDELLLFNPPATRVEAG
jgi:septum formation protein